ncbi:uncharacterized protein rab11fip5a isoform X2 [Phyllopteryx taeniolatus]|uniref:uncharacterized protein rab11fip5a isoform X2 n=1 Tax=Phyllopteryx taeniolatus TaxID=161469 RepID=UPI002AD2AB57|nr:uncharacterized protein rab11fip5a isoform X2 [Phyllopteryx taeniolatus]
MMMYLMKCPERAAAAGHDPGSGAARLEKDDDDDDDEGGRSRRDVAARREAHSSAGKRQTLPKDKKKKKKKKKKSSRSVKRLKEEGEGGRGKWEGGRGGRGGGGGGGTSRQPPPAGSTHGQRGGGRRMEQPWVPTHVQVTVLRGRGLRGKGKQGTSDVYAVIQLAKEKYSTRVAEKTTQPEWREECCFELQPGVLGTGTRTGTDTDAGPQLVLTVMHRAHIGLDVFLGQALLQLRKLFHESRGVKNQWYRLNSKTGKKEKERGDIQVSIQFTRNNLTASMYDLVMKDKGGVSTFSKLKERMRGKRRSSEDDSTSAPGATLPEGADPLCRMRQRLPSDGGGEEDYEDDEGGEVRRSKMRTFFLRGKLRKSSDTRSSTSLGSESSESSRGGSLSPTAGISVVVSDLSNSPSNSSNLTADSPEHTADTSPKLSPVRCDFSDEINEITIAVPQLYAGVNGSHKLQPRDQASAAPGASLAVGHLQKTLPLSVSLQNLRPRASADPLHGTVGDGRRWSFDKAGEEESAAIAAAMEKNCPALGREDKHEEAERDPGTEGKHKGWFRSMDLHSKPSPGPLPKLDPSTEPPVSPLHHSNPFCPSPPMSPVNPFLLQDVIYDASPPPLPFLSSSRPPIEQLFPKASHPITQIWDSPTTEDLVIKMGRVAPTTSMKEKIHLSKKSSNPFTTAEEQQPDREWDDSFEEFATCRLQGPKGQTSDSLASVHQRERGSDEGIDSLNTKGVTLSNYTNCGHLHSLDPIPEDESFEYCNNVFSTSAVSAEFYPAPEWHKANSTTNMPPCFSDPTGSSGIGSSVEDDFLSCFSSYSASDKFSACSSDETEPQTLESVVPSLEILAQTAVIPKGSSSTDELFTDSTQQTVNQSEDSDWWDSEGSLVFTPPPTMSTGMTTGLEAADMQTPENLDLQQNSNISPLSDDKNEGVPQGESSGQPSLYVRTSSPGIGHSSSFEDQEMQEGCWESPVPFKPFGSFNQSTNSLQSLYVTADSQDDQNCHSLAPSESSAVSEPAERFHSENLTFCGELGEILEAAGDSVSPDGPNNQSDWLSPVPESRPDTGEPGFTARDNMSSQFFPATDMFPKPVAGNQFAVLDGQFVKKPPPQLPKISQSTRSFLQSLNGNLARHQNQYGISEPSETLDSLEGDQFTDLGDMFVKKTSRQRPKISQSTSSFLQRLDSNWQDHQNLNCVSEPTKRVDSEKSTFCGELGEIPEPTSASVSPVGSTSGANNQPDSSSLGTEDRPDTFEPGFTDPCDLGFTAGNEGGSQFLPVTPTDSYLKPVEGDQFAVLDDVFVKKPSPELPQICQSTRSFLQSLDGNLQYHYDVATPTERIVDTNCGELGEIPNTASAAVIPECSPDDTKKPNDLLSLVTDNRPDPHEPGFTDSCESGLTAGDDGSSQDLAATPSDSYPKPVRVNQFTAFDDMFVKNTPPRLPKIFQRTRSVPSFLRSQNHYGASRHTQRRGSENSTIFGELGEVTEAAGASVSRSDSGPNINTHISDWLALVMEDRRDTRFPEGGRRSSQVLPATSKDSKPDEVLDDMFMNNPLPQRPTLHRTQSESTFAWDKTLPLSFWNEPRPLQASSTPPASPSLSTTSAPPLTRQSSCFPSFLSNASPLPATLNSQEAQESRQQHAARQEPRYPPKNNMLYTTSDSQKLGCAVFVHGVACGCPLPTRFRVGKIASSPLDLHGPLYCTEYPPPKKNKYEVEGYVKKNQGKNGGITMLFLSLCRYRYV